MIQLEGRLADLQLDLQLLPGYMNGFRPQLNISRFIRNIDINTFDSDDFIPKFWFTPTWFSRFDIRLGFTENQDASISYL